MSEVQSTKLCAFEGCVNRGGGVYCSGHAKQRRLGRTLTPLRPQRKKNGTPHCEFPGCNLSHWAKGLCCGHYGQHQAGKQLRSLFETIRPAGSPPRIPFVETPCDNPTLEGPCHVFTGGLTGRGYGQITINNKPVAVHRYVWERDVGPIPDALVIDHQCRNRACCNVNHLRVVTMKVNLTENVVGSCWQLLKARTHCPQGHPYDEENTWISKTGGRGCRTCNRLRARIRLAKEKEQRHANS